MKHYIFFIIRSAMLTGIVLFMLGCGSSNTRDDSSPEGYTEDRDENTNKRQNDTAYISSDMDTVSDGRNLNSDYDNTRVENDENAYNKSKNEPYNVAKASDKNREFINEAAELNMEEIKLGDLAMKKGTTSDVRNLGEMMMTDHRTSLDEVTQMAKRKNWRVPTENSPVAQSKYDELNATSGHAFDKMYCEMMVEGHKKAVARFERASREVTDKDLKNWVKKTLPALRKHHEHSQSSLRKTNVAMQ